MATSCWPRSGTGVGRPSNGPGRTLHPDVYVGAASRPATRVRACEAEAGGVPLALAGLALAGAAALPQAAAATVAWLKPRKCQVCYGAGYTPCHVCHGRGKLGGGFKGVELRPCAECGARGRVRCEPCAHTGLANHWLWKPSDNPGWGARGGS
ncbi:hypothetical protein HYH03_002583 [Edaphochlamys debaryana]|uniref:Uncharacterized protein n=1 Tax=Edaphochlamys debaryana TaxID=47281 RepID=A0A836C5A7_9CHLO|nr:hypothetical protein HYH03_002583 [Edaphochlamys debaryana]|eukprot:KAG2499644.1 hypothetical protein HYH03_002583 [Edaphochlamys debaryana]